MARVNNLSVTLLITLLISFTLLVSQSSQTIQVTTLHGINFAGGEYGSAMPGDYGHDYIYPSASDISLYVATMNINVIRVPFKWDRLQPRHGYPLDATELSRIDTVVSVAANHGVSVLL